MATEISNVVAGAKKHPTAAFAIVGVILALIFILRRGGGSTVQTSGAAYNAQYAQLQAALAAQQSQQGAQVQAANIAANAQNAQTAAALNVQNTQTEAQLIAALAQNQTNARSQELSAHVIDNQYSTEATVMQSQIAAELAALENTNSTQLQAYNGELQYQQVVAQNQYALNDTVLQAVTKAGLDHPINEVTALSSLAEAAIGAQGPSIATTNTGSVLAQASASKFASFFNSLSNTLSSALAVI